jgi:nucleoside-diphosphate-sugar epimerase
MMPEFGPALVTGACGFLGQHLVRALLREERTVSAVVRNRRHMAEIEHPNLTIVEVPDFALVDDKSLLHEELSLFHLAAARARPGISTAQFQAINVDAALSLAETARAARVRKFVYVSTALIFDRDEGGTASELDLNPDQDLENPYLQSRLQAMAGIQKLAKEGLELVCVCPSIIFGPDHPDHPNRITQQIRRLLRTGIDLVVGDGSRERDLVYVDDVVRGLLSAERNAESGEIFILGGEAVSHRRFNRLVLELSGRKRRLQTSIPIRAAQYAAGCVDWLRGNREGLSYEMALTSLTRSWVFSSRKAVERLSYSPAALEKGIRNTLDWLAKGMEQHG